MYVHHIRCICQMLATELVQCPCLLLHMAIGWLRLVGSLKLQVSFAEYPLFYSAHLQKRPKRM